MGKVTQTEPIPTSDDPDFHSISEDFERRFFADDEQIRVEVTLMHGTWDLIQAMITEYNWQPNEGLIILLTTGMAYLHGERALTITEGGAGYNAADLKKLLERAMTIESKYAAIRNFAFSMMRDHRTLEIKFDPVERQYHAFKALVTRLRAENEALKAENEQLKRESQATEVTAMPHPSQPAATGQASLWQRLASFLQRKS